jgi:2-polyprenyl-3-methyl-5-hydroxy-6-metoxy-1,4-benzoquinol methylase
MKYSFKKIHKFGLINIFLCLQARLKLSILKLYFGFDYWHVDSNYRCRPYKQKVVAALDSILSNGLVDVGCGLGEIGIILRKNNSMIKYHGLDIKTNVISAAKFLSRNNDNKYSTGSFESLSSLDFNHYNTLLLLNFTERLDPKNLVQLIVSNITVNIHFILIDTIHLNASGSYRYRHSAEELIDLGLPFKCINIIKNLDKFRDLLILERVSLNI